MPLDDFIKRRDADLNAQEGNFISKIDTYIAHLNLDPAEVNELKNIINEHQDSFSNLFIKKTEAKAIVGTNQEKRKKAVKALRRMSRRIKSSLTYTENIGEDLDIIGPQITKDYDNVKPELKAYTIVDIVIIKYKKGRMDGIEIHSKRGDETEFIYLATDTRSPVKDTRPKLDPAVPETRKYIAWYIYDDVQIGKPSNILTIVIP